MDSVGAADVGQISSANFKPRVAFVGFGASGKRLIGHLQGVRGFSVFLYLETPAAPDDGTMEWRFFKTTPNSPDSFVLANLEEELSLSDIVFVIDSYHLDNSKNERSAKVMELASVCGSTPIKFHISFPTFALSAYAGVVRMIKERFAIASEELMQYARDIYVERGLLSSYELSIVNKAAESLPEGNESE